MEKIDKVIEFEGRYFHIELENIQMCGKDNCKHDTTDVILHIDVNTHKALELARELAHTEFDNVKVRLDLEHYCGGKQCDSCLRYFSYDKITEFIDNVHLCPDCLHKNKLLAVV